LIGFDTGPVDDVTLKVFSNCQGTNVTQFVDRFTLDGSNYVNETPTYDAAGNLTYDGKQQYTYDAWNRLTKVGRAYYDGGLQAGSNFFTVAYDGLGRRISKTVNDLGPNTILTCHYYYDGQSTIESRNGSSQVIKQQVWGLKYIDELVQQANNLNPSTNNDCLETTDKQYWAMCDANHNVLGVADKTGLLVERYEYTPYGERKVFFSAGTSDPGCYNPTLVSQRVVISSTAQPWGLCEFGHQGLLHDEEIGLVYNRARMLHPVLGRFMQRDALDYPEGMSSYAYETGNPIVAMDPLGYASRRRTAGLMESDPPGIELASHYFTGNGRNFHAYGNEGVWNNYMQSDERLRLRVRAQLNAEFIRIFRRANTADHFIDGPTDVSGCNSRSI
jgi:RHS repeat-associated protein